MITKEKTSTSHLNLSKATLLAQPHSPLNQKKVEDASRNPNREVTEIKYRYPTNGLFGLL